MSETIADNIGRRWQLCRVQVQHLRHHHLVCQCQRVDVAIYILYVPGHLDEMGAVLGKVIVKCRVTGVEMEHVTQMPGALLQRRPVRQARRADQR